jgi:glycosyltransferase involved in cell wall biosynthesis
MRVVLFADSPRENWPSMDRYARSLFEALQRVAPEHEFILALPPEPPAGFSGRLFLLWRVFRYPLWAKRFSADVYHVLDHSYGHLIWSLDRKRTIVTVHDVAPLRLSSRSLGLSRLAWEAAWSGTQRARWWIFVSDFTKREVIEFTNKNKKQIRFSIIPYGVQSHFHPLSEKQVSEWREKLQLGFQKIILHVGHCQPRKNLENLLAALALLNRQGLAFHFIQVGGAYTPAQRRLLENLGLAHCTQQVSQIRDDNTLVALYNLASVMVMPSLYEGFGMPVLEAMACGTPVVVSNAASLPEVVGSAGLLVNPLSPASIADAIARVLEDSDLASDLRQRGFQRAREFSWERTAQETLKTYRKLLEEVI